MNITWETVRTDRRRWTIARLGRAPTGSFVILIASTEDQSAPINSHVFHHKGGLAAGSYGRASNDS